MPKWLVSFLVRKLQSTSMGMLLFVGLISLETFVFTLLYTMRIRGQLMKFRCEFEMHIKQKKAY